MAAGRTGVVLTGPSGHGRTRLALEALRDGGRGRAKDSARVAGTPETRDVPFAAFAHLLPESVTLHRAVQLLSAVRLLLVDDAHLLDDASAALVHHLAVHGRTRLLVVTTEGAPAPAAITRLWTDDLLPRLTLGPLPYDETAELLASGTGVVLDALTVNRLHRLCRGDLRLLRDLVDAVRGQLVQDGEEFGWRGPVPVTPAVREHAAAVLERAGAEREALDRLAFAEPVAVRAGDLDLGVLERLETAGLIEVGDSGGHTAVRLADPLHGPVLRAVAGRLRAARLARARVSHEAALAAELAGIERGIGAADVREVVAPVGEWIVAEGGSVPAAYAGARARVARLRGEVREAVGWAREGVRSGPGDVACLTELSLARAESGEEALPEDGVRFGGLARAEVFVRWAAAGDDASELDEVARELAERGFLLFAAEACAAAAVGHRDPRAARASRTRAVALASRCQGARTPALSGLALGELTARQRQIVTLAAAGLSNRQIAQRLTLSVRTVGNHLYGAYTRLGASDRGALPWLVEQPA